MSEIWGEGGKGRGIEVLKKDIWDGTVGFMILFGFCRFLIRLFLVVVKRKVIESYLRDRGRKRNGGGARKERDETNKGGGRRSRALLESGKLCE